MKIWYRNLKKCHFGQKQGSPTMIFWSWEAFFGISPGIHRKMGVQDPLLGITPLGGGFLESKKGVFGG